MFKSTIMAIAITIAAMAAISTSASAMSTTAQIPLAVSQASDTAEVIKVKRRGGHKRRRFYRRHLCGHWDHYGGACYWLKKKAIYTGSYYRWKRYKFGYYY